jgi:hypothetical protein
MITLQNLTAPGPMSGTGHVDATMTDNASHSRLPAGRIDVHGHALPPFYVDAVRDAGFKATVSAGYPT